MAKRPRQDLVSHLLSEGEEVLALACRAAFRQRRFIDVEGNVETVSTSSRVRAAPWLSLLHLGCNSDGEIPGATAPCTVVRSDWN